MGAVGRRRHREAVEVTQTVGDMDLNLISPVGSAMRTGRFVSSFCASLVVRGWTHVAPQEARTQDGLAAVVDLLDAIIEALRMHDTPWADIVPWVRLSNDLRMSPIGGAESWENQMVSVLGYAFDHAHTGYTIVTLPASIPMARHEMECLSPDRASLLELAVAAFEKAALLTS